MNDGSRVMSLRSGTAAWIKPAPVDDGSNPNGNPPDYLIPGITNLGTDPNQHNDGALFCSDQVQLADGRILDSGGTAYYSEPQIPGTRYGIVELQGLKTRAELEYRA